MTGTSADLQASAMFFTDASMRASAVASLAICDTCVACFSTPMSSKSPNEVSCGLILMGTCADGTNNFATRDQCLCLKFGFFKSKTTGANSLNWRVSLTSRWAAPPPRAWKASSAFLSGRPIWVTSPGTLRRSIVK